MDGLNDSFILSGEEIDTLNLFDDSDETQKTPPATGEEKPDAEEGDKDKDKPTTEEEVNPDDLFEPESVGSEDKEDKKDKEGETPDSNKDNGSSPNSNFYYSIASALVEDGVLPDLDEEFVKGIKSPEGLAEAIDKQVNARLDETQKRISAALNAELEPDEIRQYEAVLGNLEKITEDAIKDESDKGENLRKQLIFQDLINRGFSKERAAREVKKSFDSGSDIEDAKDALESNKSYFKQQYDDLIKEGQEEAENEKKRVKKEAQDLKKQMLEDKEIFEGITMDKATRQKAYDNIAKPVYKTEDGEYLTAIQKYETENPVEFRKKLGVIFTLTDGFKNLDMLVKGKVKKEVKNSLRELEHTLRNTNRPKGNPQFVGGVQEDPESYIGQGWSLDV